MGKNKAVRCEAGDLRRDEGGLQHQMMADAAAMQHMPVLVRGVPGAFLSGMCIRRVSVMLMRRMVIGMWRHGQHGLTAKGEKRQSGHHAAQQSHRAASFIRMALNPELTCCKSVGGHTPQPG